MLVSWYRIVRLCRFIHLFFRARIGTLKPRPKSGRIEGHLPSLSVRDDLTTTRIGVPVPAFSERIVSVEHFVGRTKARLEGTGVAQLSRARKATVRSGPRSQLKQRTLGLVEPGGIASLDGAIGTIVESARRLARDAKVESRHVTTKCQALYSQLKVSLPSLSVYFFLGLFAGHCLVSRSD